MICTYLSDRQIPLVYNERPQDKPVLTVENYCKWYNLYLVMPNGEVEKLDDDKIYHLIENACDTFWSDHCINPEAY